ncbi:glutathione synthase [Dacryopinax primogenitus]|uniref:Glutathione synthetase n=1 Tax=Dacryopinax primogenitus (strain DJM 731) TaxID=1858805 RepID=M5G2Z7_DACPD|nr:glutathione synthase [Dacryopinax primogenitus]EJU03074.1 glutathione synthase [Dacryopinax primogenitus]
MSSETATHSKPHALPEWPPLLSLAYQRELTDLAADWAMSHGLVYRPPANPPSEPHPSTSRVIHAPFTLFPSPLPRTLYELGRKLQPLYNALYARVALDVPWLEKTMGAVAKVDDFQLQLCKIWRQVREEGITQVQLGLWRSDYLVHTLPDGAFTLRQVEFNCISSSLGALASRTSKMHRYLQSATGYYGVHPLLDARNLPENGALQGLAAGIAEAHKAYGVPNATVLFLVQSHERNAFDQRWLEYDLLEKYGVRVERVTFSDLVASASLSESKQLLYSSPLASEPLEISVMYMRAGYTPDDYPDEKAWEVRLLVERSKAIKCPTVGAQLAGAKKVQQALMEEGVLESFMLDSSRGAEKFTEADLALLRASFAPMYPLDATTLQQTIDHADHLVLKPQREGGGNNVYRSNIPSFLEKLPVAERDAWVVMELIEPPPSRSVLIKAGTSEQGGTEGDVISELGVYGVCLYRKDSEGTCVIDVNRECGYLVRTKGRESNEGGVAVGFSYLDSLVLVD